MMTDPRRDRLEELLEREATQGLPPGEAAELDALLAAYPDEDPDAIELAAAAVHLALSPPPEAMPPALAAKLHAAAAAVTPTAASAPTPSAPGPARPAAGARSPWFTWGGWAIAASLAAVLLWTLWPKPPKPGPSLAEEWKKIEQEPDAKTFAGTGTNASANIVWSNTAQDGVLEVHGLPANDPDKEKYQLWIVDPAHKEPVDGGVFDVQPNCTTVVKVRHPIRVTDAVAFAITKEKAPGVVVSKGPHLVVLTPKKG